MYGWSAVKHSSIYILIKDEEKKRDYRIHALQRLLKSIG